MDKKQELKFIKEKLARQDKLINKILLLLENNNVPPFEGLAIIKLVEGHMYSAIDTANSISIIKNNEKSMEVQ